MGTVLTAAPPTGIRPPDSLLARLFGSVRHALSQAAYEQADVFFHKGARPHVETAFSNSLFQTVALDISPMAHVHAGGSAIREIMPWLRMATHADPDNLEPYLVAAFWIMREEHRADIAESILLEAQRANPDSYEVALERGRLALKVNDLARAAAHFDRALQLWPGTRNPSERHVQLDIMECLLYRGLLFETEGNTNSALQAFRLSHSLDPETSQLETRIHALETGTPPPIPADELWTLVWDDKFRPDCGHDHDHEHDHDHHPAESTAARIRPPPHDAHRAQGTGE